MFLLNHVILLMTEPVSKQKQHQKTKICHVVRPPCKVFKPHSSPTTRTFYSRPPTDCSHTSSWFFKETLIILIWKLLSTPNNHFDEMEDILNSPPTTTTTFQLFTPAFHHSFHHSSSIDKCRILIYRVIYNLSAFPSSISIHLCLSALSTFLQSKWPIW